jgi:hypothetical protein
LEALAVETQQDLIIKHQAVAAVLALEVTE